MVSKSHGLRDEIHLDLTLLLYRHDLLPGWSNRSVKDTLSYNYHFYQIMLSASSEMDVINSAPAG